MKAISQLSKAISVGVMSALLLVAATSNQVALGAASVSNVAPPTIAMSTDSQMWLANIVGDFIQGIIDGRANGIGSAVSEQSTMLAMQQYQSTDFSQFD